MKWICYINGGNEAINLYEAMSLRCSQKFVKNAACFQIFMPD